MTFKDKLNRLTDFLLKFGVLALAFSVALIPVIFLLGHENLHQQTWNDSMAGHTQRGSELTSVKGLRVSNVYLRESGGVNGKSVRETM